MNAQETGAEVAQREAGRLARELQPSIQNDRATTVQLLCSTAGLLWECVERSMLQAPGLHGQIYRTMNVDLRREAYYKTHLWLAKKMDSDFDRAGVYCTDCATEAETIEVIIRNGLMSVPLITLMREAIKGFYAYPRSEHRVNRSLEQEDNGIAGDEADTSEDDVQSRTTISEPDIDDAFCSLSFHIDNVLTEAVVAGIYRIVDNCSSPAEIQACLSVWYTRAAPMIPQEIFSARTFGCRKVSIWGDTADECSVIRGIEDFIADNLYRELLMFPSLYEHDSRSRYRLEHAVAQMITQLPWYHLIPPKMMTFGEESTPVSGNIYNQPLPPANVPLGPSLSSPPRTVEFEPCLAEDLMGQYGPENVHLDAISEEFPPDFGEECSICGMDNNHLEENHCLRRLDVCGHTICSCCLQGNIDSRMRYRYRCPFCRENMLGIDDEAEAAQATAVEGPHEAPVAESALEDYNPRQIIITPTDTDAKFRRWLLPSPRKPRCRGRSSDGNTQGW